MAAPFDLIDEAKRLVRFNTTTWASNADCAVHVGHLFRKLGCQVFYQEIRANGVLFMNVIGLIGQGKNPLLMATHLDTVDAGDPKLWTKSGGDPWRMTIRGDSIYGLGVADTKLDLLCKLSAVGRCPTADFKRPLILLGTFGEESGLRGAARFCQGEMTRPAMALVGEPTELSLVPRHKGLAVMEILFRERGLHRPSSAEWVYEATFVGQAAHSSTPQMGVNALDAGVRFLQGLRTRYKKIAVLSWEGGNGHNIIPASATIRFSIGGIPKVSFPSNAKQRVKIQRLEPGWYPTLPWEAAIWSIETAQKLIEPLQKEKEKEFQPPTLTWNVTRLSETKEGWTLVFDLRPLPGQSIQRVIKNLETKLWKQFGAPGDTWQFRFERDNPSLDLDRKSELVKLAQGALRRARLPLKVVAKSGCSEAGLFNRVGIPSLVFGPGRSAGNIHRPNEMASIRQLKQAARFYQSFLERACF